MPMNTSGEYCLLLDTASHNCSVALAKGSALVAVKEVNEAHIHSQKLGVFIQEVLATGGITSKNLGCVAVGKGPGSYTGLRIGVATAKALCFALDIPLIGINTLHSMAAQTFEQAENPKAFHVPMLDARRMEVYTAVWDGNLNCYRETEPKVIETGSFADLLEAHKVYFSGNGMPKAKPYLEPFANAHFVDGIWPSARYMVAEAYRKWEAGETEPVSTFEPFYLKAFRANSGSKIEKVLKS